MGKLKEYGKRLIPSNIRENYWRQAVKKKEKIRIILRVIGLLGITSWLFYQSFWALLFLIPAGVILYRLQIEDLIHRKRSRFLIQFRELIQGMSASLNTGYSVENALCETQKELLLLYPEDELIQKELRLIVRQIKIQIPIEKILDEFAARVDLEDVYSFTTVFAAAKRSGGDMMAIIKNTVHQISDKIDVNREIDTLLAAKKYEFKVMCMIPYFIIAYMVVSFPEFMSCLYGNAIGIGVMSGCLIIYGGAYLLGLKLIKIEV